MAGNLFWFLVGLLAVTGPVAGTASSVIMRAFFGVHGNRVIGGSGLGWLTAVGYEAINLAISTLASLAFVERFGIGIGIGIGSSTPAKIIVLLVVGVATFTISIYGHATIVRMSKALTFGLTLCLLFVGAFVASGAHFGSYTPQGASAPLSAVMIGFTIIASGPLSWLTGADYSRYLPQRTSRTAVAGWTMTGGFLAAVLLGFIGILTWDQAVEMSDPQTSIR